MDLLDHQETEGMQEQPEPPDLMEPMEEMDLMYVYTSIILE